MPRPTTDGRLDTVRPAVGYDAACSLYRRTS